MNHVTNAFAESGGRLDRFAKGYAAYLSHLLDTLDWNAVGAFVDALERARADHRTVYFVGNGGSAATASHFATDLGKGTRAPGQPGFRAISLCDNVALMTALANDEGYDRIFVGQMTDVFGARDVLVAISTSGNSPNVLEAARFARARGGVVVSLVGFDGGQLPALSDVTVHVRSEKGEYGPVEDLHLILDHIVTLFLAYQGGTAGAGR